MRGQAILVDTRTDEIFMIIVALACRVLVGWPLGFVGESELLAPLPDITQLRNIIVTDAFAGPLQMVNVSAVFSEQIGRVAHDLAQQSCPIHFGRGGH